MPNRYRPRPSKSPRHSRKCQLALTGLSRPMAEHGRIGAAPKSLERRRCHAISRVLDTYRMTTIELRSEMAESTSCQDQQPKYFIMIRWRCADIYPRKRRRCGRMLEAGCVRRRAWRRHVACWASRPRKVAISKRFMSTAYHNRQQYACPMPRLHAWGIARGRNRAPALTRHLPSLARCRRDDITGVPARTSI